MDTGPTDGLPSVGWEKPQTQLVQKVDPGPTDGLPVVISDFQKQFANLNARQVRGAATEDFGWPTRDIGKGLSIPQWDVDGGTLTVHPLRGPTFKKRDGEIVWLIATKNPASENLCTDFEMDTLPDLANRGTEYWIGDVAITNDESYRFTDGGQNLGERGDQSRNFFMRHAAGKVSVAWSRDIAPDTPLDSVGDRAIAQLTFTDDSQGDHLSIYVVSSPVSRMLTFTQPGFVMWALWRHFWRVGR